MNRSANTLNLFAKFESLEVPRVDGAGWATSGKHRPGSSVGAGRRCGRHRLGPSSATTSASAKAVCGETMPSLRTMYGARSPPRRTVRASRTPVPVSLQSAMRSCRQGEVCGAGARRDRGATRAERADDSLCGQGLRCCRSARRHRHILRTVKAAEPAGDADSGSSRDGESRPRAVIQAHEYGRALRESPQVLRIRNTCGGSSAFFAPFVADRRRQWPILRSPDFGRATSRSWRAWTFAPDPQGPSLKRNRSR